MEYFITDEIRERISKAKRFVFVRNPKCGSTTIIKRLCYNLKGGFNEDDLSTDIHVSPHFKVLQHQYSHKELKHISGDTVIFASVRNTFDRYLSGLDHVMHKITMTDGVHKNYYKCMREQLDYNYDNLTPGKLKDAYYLSHPPEDYHNTHIEGCTEECFLMGHHLFIPQVETIKSNLGYLELDFVVDMPEVLELTHLIGQRLAELEGIEYRELNMLRFNKSKSMIKKNHYYKRHPRLEGFVRRHFADDLAKFGEKYGWVKHEDL